MKTSFTLELYFEDDCDRTFAEQEAAKLIELVRALAPHLVLEVKTRKATAISRSRFRFEDTQYDVPNQVPSRQGCQSLLITKEPIGASGWAGRGQGCLSKQALDEKAKKGANSADISLHEWMHTIEGLEINGRKIPHLHQNKELGFPSASGQGPDGENTWHDWYRYVLRNH